MMVPSFPTLFGWEGLKPLELAWVEEVYYRARMMGFKRTLGGVGGEIGSPAGTKAATRHVSFHHWLQEPFMSCLCFSVCASQLFLLAIWLFLRAPRHSSAQNPSLQVTPQSARLFSLTSPLPAANLFSFSECKLPFSVAFWSRVHHGMSCVVRVLHEMNRSVLFCSTKKCWLWP